MPIRRTLQDCADAQVSPRTVRDGVTPLSSAITTRPSKCVVAGDVAAVVELAKIARVCRVSREVVVRPSGPPRLPPLFLGLRVRLPRSALRGLSSRGRAAHDRIVEGPAHAPRRSERHLWRACVRRGHRGRGRVDLVASNSSTPEPSNFPRSSLPTKNARQPDVAATLAATTRRPRGSEPRSTTSPDTR